MPSVKTVQHLFAKELIVWRLQPAKIVAAGAAEFSV
jgi:hypothetical protein